jgi:hypothetical protein
MDQAFKERANNIVLSFSLYCKDNGEKVFEPETEVTVCSKLVEAFGFIPTFALREYGEVLNRNPVKVHSTVTYWR